MAGSGGRFIAAFSFLDNFFVLGIPHVVIFVCLAALCPGDIHGSPNSLSVLRSEASEGQFCHCPEAGEE